MDKNILKNYRPVSNPSFISKLDKYKIEEIKNLGVIFDSENTFDTNLGKVCHAPYYHLRDL